MQNNEELASLPAKKLQNAFYLDAKHFEDPFSLYNDFYFFAGVLKETFISLYIFTDIVVNRYNNIALLKSGDLRRGFFHNIPNHYLTVHPVKTQSGVRIVELVPVMCVGA